MTSAPVCVIAVLTYQREQQLVALLPELSRQAAASPEPTVLLVVDNDPGRSASRAVHDLDDPRVRYVSEPVPGIAAARNRALREARGSRLLVFIDDDEWPGATWLELLLTTYRASRPAAVSGPVLTHYASAPSAWMSAGRFFDRPRPPTGTLLGAAATNNLLLDLVQVEELGVAFDERYGLSGGSDTLFTRQLAARGGRLVWCDEAEVVDVLPPSRASLRWVLTRSLRIGITWSRTSLDLASTRSGRALQRGLAAVGGLARIGAGCLRLVVGLLTASPPLQARGLKGTARGVGLLVGAYGVVYTEYRRAGVSDARAGRA